MTLTFLNLLMLALWTCVICAREDSRTLEKNAECAFSCSGLDYCMRSVCPVASCKISFFFFFRDLLFGPPSHCLKFYYCYLSSHLVVYFLFMSGCSVIGCLHQGAVVLQGSKATYHQV